MISHGVARRTSLLTDYEFGKAQSKTKQINIPSDISDIIDDLRFIDRDNYCDHGLYRSMENACESLEMLVSHELDIMDSLQLSNYEMKETYRRLLRKVRRRQPVFSGEAKENELKFSSGGKKILTLTPGCDSSAIGQR
ncbi:hypothetical protein M514_00751 [Trichuris suis]|uniref:Uncharacterized protein n=1 Tax=Trichuris suis TaxID=68888 RepID=A0A085N9F6_9BILA|nr:hypothetical protein M513_00751 [Trichuris suis]KFD66102.1 hypothetical protein M514_00751 [Trichuris suis]